MEDIDKVYMMSGSTIGDSQTSRMREWTGSNPGTGRELGDAFQPWFGRALFATQSYFITAHNASAEVLIQNGEDDTFEASVNAQINNNPMPLAYGKGKALVGLSHTTRKAILDLDFSDLNNPSISFSYRGSSGYRINGGNISNGVNTPTLNVDAVYDSVNNTFYTLDYNGFRGNFATCSIAEITGSATSTSDYLNIEGYQTSSLSFSDPFQGANSSTSDYGARTMGIKESTSELFIYNRGEWFSTYRNDASIIKFDYSSGVTSGTFTKIIPLTQPEGGLSGGSGDYSAYGGLIYSSQNDVIVIGTYDTGSTEGRVRVYNATSPYTLLQTITGPFMSSYTTETKEGNIVFWDSINHGSTGGRYVVLTPNTGDSLTFSYNVSYYDYDPSQTIELNDSDSVFVKLQLKDPIATSPNGSKFRLTIGNDGAVTGSVI